MIELEEKIRRYATAVAGPAVGDPPADLAEVGQRHSRLGRYMLVAALAFFVAGLTFIATRSDEGSTPPTVDTAPARPSSSWPGEPATCVNQTPPPIGIRTGPSYLEGIQMQGADAEGICLGLGPGNDDGTTWIDPALDDGTVWLTTEGQALNAVSINRCTVQGGGGSGTTFGDRDLAVWIFQPEVSTVEFTSGNDRTITATTFMPPGVEGFTIAVIWMPPMPTATVPTARYAADGSLLEDPPDTGPLTIPADCPNSGLPTRS